MIIQKVKEYNKMAKARYKEAVKNWDYKKGGFPCLAMYIWIKDNGQERKKGFIISEGNSHFFKLTKKEVETFGKE